MNEDNIYKESLINGEIIGFESIVSNVYHSSATANTMVTVRYIKKSCI